MQRDGQLSRQGVLSVPVKVETVDQGVLLPIAFAPYQRQAVRYFVRDEDQKLQAINMIDQPRFAAGSDVHPRPQDCAALPG